MNSHNPLPLALLLLRLSTFVVFAMWTIDKFLNPGHAAAVFGAFYGLPGLSDTVFYLVGAAQALVILAFVAGAWKRISYGLVLAMHSVATLSAWERYLDPWSSPNLLFFAALPMLACIAALYLLRDSDTLLTVEA